MSSVRKTEAMSDAQASTSKLAERVQTAEYIVDMAHQLERLAAGGGLVRLAEILAAAREEARRQAFG